MTLEPGTTCCCTDMGGGVMLTGGCDLHDPFTGAKVRQPGEFTGLESVLEWDGMLLGYCHRCRKPAGMVPWSSADWVFHRKCAKAEEAYTPPGRQLPA